MNVNIYSIHDKAANCYSAPFFMATDAMAERAFTQAVNSTENQYGKAPEDYTLFCVGTWDDDKGLLTPAEINGKIGNGLQYLSPE